jgi:exodeoxyribonuclease-3
MKIITWNVNGLRANLNKGGVEWVLTQDADVICLQEVKASIDRLTPEQLKILENDYFVYWNPAQKPGYSGVITLSKNKVEELIMKIGEERFDVEGRLIRSRHPGFILFNVYFPNGKRDVSRLSYKLNFYEKLLGELDRLHGSGEKIILCGDTNTAHKPIDLRNPKQNEKTSGFLPEERAWLDLYLEHGFIDVFRYLYPDEVKYTWWTYRVNARERNIGWRLDNFYVTKELVKYVIDVTIHKEVLGSDHCPVTINLDL